jgi:hypothetical protein
MGYVMIVGVVDIINEDLGRQPSTPLKSQKGKICRGLVRAVS